MRNRDNARNRQVGRGGRGSQQPEHVGGGGREPQLRDQRGGRAWMRGQGGGGEWAGGRGSDEHDDGIAREDGAEWTQGEFGADYDERVDHQGERVDWRSGDGRMGGRGTVRDRSLGGAGMGPSGGGMRRRSVIGNLGGTGGGMGTMGGYGIGFGMGGGGFGTTGRVGGMDAFGHGGYRGGLEGASSNFEGMNRETMPRGVEEMGRGGIQVWGRDSVVDPRDTDRGPHWGKGPKGYKRSDERIKEDVCEAIARQGFVDASEVEVSVDGGIVRLFGTVGDRTAKRSLEQMVEHIRGVDDVQNEIRVARQQPPQREGGGQPSIRNGTTDEGGARSTRSVHS